jgi:hypothetical protein
VKVNVNVQLEEDDPPIDREDAALAIFRVLNGNSSKDEITLYVQAAAPDPVRIGPEIGTPSLPEAEQEE